MKLRNKKTGEIIDLQEIIHQKYQEHNYNSLAELNEEWEDYEEPKMTGWYFINDLLNVKEYDNDDYPCRIEEDVYNAKAVGNYFETKEEAEKAVEKLKAWKRLKDRGFRFTGFSGGRTIIEFTFDKSGEPSSAYKDLDLLFGGEE